MPFQSRRAPLVLTEETRRQLDLIGRSRTEPRHRVDRARMLLKYAAGESVSAVARALGTNRPRIERCLDKALQIGPLAALSDLPGRGHPTSITDDAKAWVTSLACQKPKELGYSSERWTTDLLARHIRRCLQKERTSIAEETGPRHRVEDLDPGRDSPAQDSVLPGTAR